ncbi:MAG: MlaA family lipoprotein [Phycisphaerae bacterium]
MRVHSPGRFSKRVFILVISFVLVSSSACKIPVKHHDWSQYDGPGAEHFHREEYVLPYVADPLEPVNRLSFGLTTAFVVGVADPIAGGWRAIVPQPVRRSLVGAVNNATYPQRGVNHLLQGNTDAAADETKRFAINTTEGVAGLDDPAARKHGIPPQPTSTGETLQRWGWQDSTYLVMPLRGPSTVRDALGGIGDFYLNPLAYFYVPGVGIESGIITAEFTGVGKRYLTTQVDAYEPSRRLYLEQRRDVRHLTDPATESENSAAVQSLGFAALRPQNQDFASRGKTYKVRIRATGKKLPYTLWLQKQAAPVVFVLPGFGGHRQSAASLMLAELLYNEGYSVAAVSSATNFEFMRSAATTPVPGYPLIDAADTQAALDAVWRDMRNEHGNRVTGKLLVGMSLGGYHALHIAALRRDAASDYEAILAINPPVQLDYAAQQPDEYFNAFMSFPVDERDDRAALALQKIAQRSQPVDRTAAPISDTEAQFLVGLSYRLALHDMIWVSRARRDPGFLETRWTPLEKAAASQEILSYSLMEYAYGFLFPYLRDEANVIHSADEMFRRSDLRMVEEPLRNAANVGVLTNANDFLLSTEDVDWLRGLLGPSRLRLFERGGHLGNLNEPAVRDALVRLLRDLQRSANTRAPSHASVIDDRTTSTAPNRIEMMTIAKP